MLFIFLSWMSAPLLIYKKEDVVVRVIMSAEIMRLSKPVPLLKASYINHKCTHMHTLFSRTPILVNVTKTFSLACLILLRFLTNDHLVIYRGTATSLFLRLFFFSRVVCKSACVKVISQVQLWFGAMIYKC